MPFEPLGTFFLRHARRRVHTHAHTHTHTHTLARSLLVCAVDVGNVRSSMGSLFGDDASAKSVDYAKYIEMAKKVCVSMCV